MNFPRVLELVSGFLTQHHFRHALAGALALHAHGLSRATADVDLVVDSAARSELLPFLESLGYELLHQSDGYSNHLHPLPSLGRLDFIYVDGATADAVFAAAKSVRLFSDVVVPVPRPEHLAAMKVLALKNDPSRRFKELADLQFLLGLPEVDEAEIRGYFERSGQLESFDEIKQALAAARAREEPEDDG